MRGQLNASPVQQLLCGTIDHKYHRCAEHNNTGSGSAVEDELSEEVFAAVLLRAAEIHIEEVKPLQHVCLKYLINRRDVLGCLPTGFGKYLI